MATCEICGRERTTWVPEQTMGAFVVPWAEAAKCWNGNGGADDREHWRLGYDNAVKCGLKLSVELSEQKARADAAVAEIVNEQRRFGELQRESWKLDEALAAARRECEGTGTAMRATHLMCGTCETDIYGEDGVLVTSQVAGCSACKVLRDVLAGSGPCPSTMTCGDLFYRCALEPGHDGPHADRVAGDVRAAEWGSLAAPAAREEGKR